MDTVSKSLLTQLDNLPRKAMKQLEGLLTIGHIDEHVLQTVLDAGILSGETARLPAFATSYLYLKLQGVPVADVIQMAMQDKGTININLWWSARRWHDEHSRLSRLSTLRRLAEDDANYDISFFSSQVPKSVPGYLISSSRRLGMEGLRQRHCVASWHEKLLRGDCAICVVFVDKTRWTVELIKTGNDHTPVRIGQIKTRLNQNPKVEDRKAIHQALHIEEAITSMRQAKIQAEKDWKVNAVYILPVLRRHQVESVDVSFSGSGDEGYIDDVRLTPDVGDQVVEIMQFTRRWEDGTWYVEGELVEKPLKEAIEIMTYDYLETTGIDWYNNGGGQGELCINMEDELISLNIGTNYTETVSEFDSDTEFSELFENEEMVA